MKTELFSLVLGLFAYATQAKQYFGEKITDDSAISTTELMDELAEEGSMQTKVKGEVTDVCQVKGCWMTLNVDENQEIMVRFKDYGFFVPKDITGQTVVVAGQAVIDTVSVEDQRHLAEDAGMPEEEINKITEPKPQLFFVADGVSVEDE
ncbi:MAG: DUF4920 domain-containing protein [Cyclobacteriaceae bacterium]